MRRLVPICLTLSLLAGPAAAQVKFSRCISQNEKKTEQIIRHGIFLREGSSRCEEYVAGTAKKWADFNSRFGQQLAGETAKRKKVFDREFKSNSVEVMTYFDGRLVTYYRYYPLNSSYCSHVDKLLTEAGKRGWKAFAKQAEITQADIITDLKICK